MEIWSGGAVEGAVATDSWRSVQREGEARVFDLHGRLERRGWVFVLLLLLLMLLLMLLTANNIDFERGRGGQESE